MNSPVEMVTSHPVSWGHSVYSKDSYTMSAASVNESTWRVAFQQRYRSPINRMAMNGVTMLLKQTKDLIIDRSINIYIYAYIHIYDPSINHLNDLYSRRTAPLASWYALVWTSPETEVWTNGTSYVMVFFRLAHALPTPMHSNMICQKRQAPALIILDESPMIWHLFIQTVIRMEVLLRCTLGGRSQLHCWHYPTHG